MTTSCASSPASRSWSTPRAPNCSTARRWSTRTHCRARDSTSRTPTRRAPAVAATPSARAARAPVTFGPYSHWRRAGDLVVISGQLGVVPGQRSSDVRRGRRARATSSGTRQRARRARRSRRHVRPSRQGDHCSSPTWPSSPRATRSGSQSSSRRGRRVRRVAVAQLPLGALAEVELWAYAPLD